MFDEILHLLNTSTVLRSLQVVELIVYGHHPEVATNFPHHFHDEIGQLKPSMLSGNPMTDLPFVLLEIQDYLQRLNQAL